MPPISCDRHYNVITVKRKKGARTQTEKHSAHRFIHQLLSEIFTSINSSDCDGMIHFFISHISIQFHTFPLCRVIIRGNPFQLVTAALIANPHWQGSLGGENNRRGREGGFRGSGQLKWRDGVRERVELKGLKGKATEIRREKERAQKWKEEKKEAGR